MSLHEAGPDDLPSANYANPHGEAALLIVESLLHTLLERSVLTVEDAVETLQTAVEVKTVTGSEAGEPKERMHASLDLMFRILDSLAADLPVKGTGTARLD
jgi:hypothetical protein